MRHFAWNESPGYIDLYDLCCILPFCNLFFNRRIFFLSNLIISFVYFVCFVKNCSWKKCQSLGGSIYFLHLLYNAILIYMNIYIYIYMIYIYNISKRYPNHTLMPIDLHTNAPACDFSRLGSYRSHEQRVSSLHEPQWRGSPRFQGEGGNWKNRNKNWKRGEVFKEETLWLPLIVLGVLNKGSMKSPARQFLANGTCWKPSRMVFSEEKALQKTPQKQGNNGQHIQGY